MDPYRDLFDDAIGASPRSSVDVDAVIAGERRAIRRRRFAVVSTVAAAVAAIGVMTAAFLPGDGAAPRTTHAAGPGRPTAPASPSSSTPTQAASTPARPVHTGRPSASSSLGPDQAEQLWPAVQQAILSNVPHAKLLPPSCGTPRPDAFLALCPHGKAGPVTVQLNDASPGAPYFLAASDVHMVDSTTGLFIAIRPAAAPPHCPPASPAAACTESRGPHGELIVTSTRVGLPGTIADTATNTVSVLHADGTEVIATAQNWPASDGDSFKIEAKHPAVATHQLREIALTPQIALAH